METSLALNKHISFWICWTYRVIGSAKGSYFPTVVEQESCAQLQLAAAQGRICKSTFQIASVLQHKTFKTCKQLTKKDTTGRPIYRAWNGKHLKASVFVEPLVQGGRTPHTAQPRRGLYDRSLLIH